MLSYIIGWLNVEYDCLSVYEDISEHRHKTYHIYTQLIFLTSLLTAILNNFCFSIKQ